MFVVSLLASGGQRTSSLPATTHLPQGVMPSAVVGAQNANVGGVLLSNHVPLVGSQDQPLTMQPVTRKEWHAQVTQDLRNHLVHKL